MKKNIGSLLAIALGALLVFSGFGQQQVSVANAGIIMLIGAFAYRSAKKRSLGEVPDSTIRSLTELAGMAVIILLIVMQNNLISLMVTDPVPNVIIPVWALVAYLIIRIKGKAN